MSHLSKIWTRIERILIYVTIAIFFLAEVLATFIPWVQNLLNVNGSFLLIALILFCLFRILDERLPEKAAVLEQYRESFGDMVNCTIGNDDHFKEVVIFAHTSIKYFGFVRDKKIKIDNLRLLISDPAYMMSKEPSKKDIEDSTAELNIALNNWYRLKNDGYISSLEIHKYNFSPSFHFIIVDWKRSGFGLFRPDSTSSQRYRTMTNFVYYANTISGKHYIDDLERFFNIIYHNFSEEVKPKESPELKVPV